MEDFMCKNGLPCQAILEHKCKVKAKSPVQCQIQEDLAKIVMNAGGGGSRQVFAELYVVHGTDVWKCDLGQPECQRCIKMGKRCPGYRDVSTLLFKNEDILTLSGPSASRDRSRSSQAQDQPTSDRSGTSTSLRPERQSLLSHGQTAPPKIHSMRMDRLLSKGGWNPPPSRERPEEWEAYTMPLVLSLFSHNNRPFCLCRDLPMMLLGATGDSPLLLSSKALGFAVLSNKVSIDSAQSARGNAYGKALVATNAVLSDPELCKHDAALMSVWLLSIYEVVTASESSTSFLGPINWSIHTEGLIELLRIRGPEQLRVEHSRNIFWLLVSSVQMRSLIGGLGCPPFIDEWVGAYEAECPSDELDRLHVVRFAGQSAKVCAEICQALDSGTLDSIPWSIQQLWSEVQRLQSVLEEAQPHSSQPEASATVKPHIQNQYRTCHTRTLQFVYQLLESDLPKQDLTTDTATTNHIRTQVTTSIQRLAAATIHTAERVLGPATSTSDSSMPDWFDVLRILWPLRILCGRKHVLLASQVEIAEIMLQRISGDFCIRQAVAPYKVSASPEFHTR